jgi:TolA-binding protein
MVSWIRAATSDWTKTNRNAAARRQACGAAIVALMCAAQPALAVRARVTLPGGDRHTGEWVGSAENQYVLLLDNGQELALRIEAGTVVEFFDRPEDIVPVEAALRLRAGLDALELDLGDVAESSFRAAVALAPRYARAHHELAKHLESQGKSPEEAYRHFLLAARLDPQAYPIGERVRGGADRALQRGDPATAGRLLRRYAESVPNSPTAADAAYDASAYLAQSADAAPADTNLGQEAVAAHRSALALFPNHPRREEALLRLGALLHRTGASVEAIATLNDLITQYPNTRRAADARLTLALAYRQTGDMQTALAHARWVVQHAESAALREEARALVAERLWTVLTPEHGLLGKEVTAVLRDGQFLWAGTTEGLRKLDMAAGAPAQGVPDIPAGTIIRALAADRRNVWIGTGNRGLIRYAKDTAKTTFFTRLDGLPGNNILAVDLDENEVWVGGLGGVSRFNIMTNEWTPFRPNEEFTARDVTSLILTPDHVWVGTENGGIARHNRSDGSWETFTTLEGVGSNSIRGIARTRNGVVVAWSTDKENGYTEWDATTGRWQTTPIGPDEIAPRDIRVEYENGTLWVATGEALLFRDATGRWGTVDYPPTLKSARIYALYARADIVWVGTSEGLGRLDARTMAAGRNRG